MNRSLITVHIGDPLLMFLTSAPERFGVVNPEYVIRALNDGQSPLVHYLIDELPLLKQCYTLIDSLQNLMMLYLEINLEYLWRTHKIYLDHYMDEFFGGRISAPYYISRQGKIPMDDAVKRGLIIL